MNRVFNLILDDTFLRNFKDYGGALLQGKGKRDGHYEWAKQMNIQNYDYDSVFHLQFLHIHIQVSSTF